MVVVVVVVAVIVVVFRRRRRRARPLVSLASLSVPPGDDEHGRTVRGRACDAADQDADRRRAHRRPAAVVAAQGRAVLARFRVFGRAPAVGPVPRARQRLVGQDREARVDHEHERRDAGVDVVVHLAGRRLEVELERVDEVGRDEDQGERGDVVQLLGRVVRLKRVHGDLLDGDRQAVGDAQR